MKIRILGCGGSQGVPRVGCRCDVCCSIDPKDYRLRPSVIVEKDNGFVMIDASPDCREQLLRYERDGGDLSKFQGLVITHAHADHVHGVDDLRAFCFVNKRNVPVYSDEKTLDELEQRFAYAFYEKKKTRDWDRCYLRSERVKCFEEFSIGNISDVTLLLQYHGVWMSNGVKFGDDFAYCTDLCSFHPWAIRELKKKRLKLLVLDCLRGTPSFSHLSFEGAVELVREIKPERTILTHMTHDVSYNDFLKSCKELDLNIEPGYDDMEIEI